MYCLSVIQCTFLYFASVTKLYDNLEVEANLTWITSSDIKSEQIKTSFTMEEVVKEKYLDCSCSVDRIS